ncbi:MAG: hypothetical protein BGO03_05665 [Mesorhizobium sp. 61-13]|nr:MAG: hypothetical protein BGO03_05665 [Mesorhizobium sp. 61-13]
MGGGAALLLGKGGQFDAGGDEEEALGETFVPARGAFRRADVERTAGLVAAAGTVFARVMKAGRGGKQPPRHQHLGPRLPARRKQFGKCRGRLRHARADQLDLMMEK